jgi:putative tryptophan/tyrosine transport system substrate-binding protein
MTGISPEAGGRQWRLLLLLSLTHVGFASGQSPSRLPSQSGAIRRRLSKTGFEIHSPTRSSMTTRRAVLRVLGLPALMACASRASGQQPRNIPRVVALWFASSSDPLARRNFALFRQRLRELGYVEGKSIVVDERFADGSAQRLKELARELVEAKADIIVAAGVAASIAARQATDTIPIVMLRAGNPIDAGLISSLARPGGNVTGTANLSLGGKHVELMREILPHMTRLPVLINPTNAVARLFVAGMTEAARNTNIAVTIVEVSRPEDFPQAYASLRNARADWLHVADEPMISARRAEWIEFASSARLPLSSDVGEPRDWVDSSRIHPC